MELKDTVEGMLSPDYKERFKAEYQQTLIRYEKLSDLIEKWINNELDFTPTCPIGVLCRQVELMEEYLIVLDTRADVEGIDLDD